MKCKLVPVICDCNNCLHVNGDPHPYNKVCGWRSKDKLADAYCEDFLPGGIPRYSYGANGFVAIGPHWKNCTYINNVWYEKEEMK